MSKTLTGRFQVEIREQSPAFTQGVALTVQTARAAGLFQSCSQRRASETCRNLPPREGTGFSLDFGNNLAEPQSALSLR